MLFFTGYAFTNENIVYVYMKNFFNYVSKAPSHVTIIHSYIIIDGYSISNTTGSLISPKYKANFTLPEEAWCIAENIFYKENDPLTYKKIYYEDENDIKMVKWSQDCIPETTIIKNQNLLKKFFAIRTIHSLTYGNVKTYIEKRKKYLLDSDITQSNSVIDYNGDRIFNEFLPNEIVSNMIIYLDYKTLFCTLPCVNKKFDTFIKKFDIHFNIKKSIQEDSNSYTQLVGNMLLSNEQPFPINVLHDPRFSHKKFKEQWNISIEEDVWNSSLIVKKQGNNVYLVHSKNRTDQQFTELLRACLLNNKHTPIKISQKKAKSLTLLMKNYLSKIEYRFKKCNDRSRANDYLDEKYLKYEKFFKKELEEVVFFICIWDEIFKLLTNTKDQASKEFCISKQFYNKPSLLTILIELLYKNLDNKRITLTDIPHTFLEYARNISQPLCTTSNKDLEKDMLILKNTFAKNKNYCKDILNHHFNDVLISKKILGCFLFSLYFTYLFMKKQVNADMFYIKKTASLVYKIAMFVVASIV
jgi:hypothetical protein